MKTQEKIDGDGWRPSREEINQFIQDQVIGVISTLDETGAPASATVAFSVSLGGELIVGTKEDSEKSQNIDHNEHVAVTITNADTRHTLQVKGKARKLAKAVFEADYAKEHYRQRPQSLPFRDDPEQCHIAITPTRLKFSDVSVFPWVVTTYYPKEKNEP
jgi:general stress protein 26